MLSSQLDHDLRTNKRANLVIADIGVSTFVNVVIDVTVTIVGIATFVVY